MEEIIYKLQIDNGKNCPITIIPLYFRMVFFLSCDHGLDFLHEFILCENSINQAINQSIK